MARLHPPLPVLLATCRPARVSPPAPKHGLCDTLVPARRYCSLDGCVCPAPPGPKPVRRWSAPTIAPDDGLPVRSSGCAPPEGEARPRGLTTGLPVSRPRRRSALPRAGRSPCSAWLLAAAPPGDAPVRPLSTAAPKHSRGVRPSRFAGPAPRPPLAGRLPGRSPQACRSAAAAPSGNGAVTHQRPATPKCDRLPGARPLRWSPDPDRRAQPAVRAEARPPRCRCGRSSE